MLGKILKHWYKGDLQHNMGNKVKKEVAKTALKLVLILIVLGGIAFVFGMGFILDSLFGR